MTPLERYRYIRTLRMPAYPRLVLWTLTCHADKDGKLWISQALLAAESSQSVRRCRDSIAWLCRYGLILEIPRQGRSSAFAVTLETYQDLQATPAPRAAPPRHTVPTEVAPKKMRKRKSAPYYAQQCIHCGIDLKDTRYNICGTCPEERAKTTSADIIRLFPEAKAKP